jgi:hypothetical protein
MVREGWCARATAWVWKLVSYTHHIWCPVYHYHMKSKIVILTLIFLCLTSTTFAFCIEVIQISEVNFGVAYDIEYTGNTVYVTGNHGVEVIDISDRSTPETIKQLNIAEGCFGVEIEGDRLYVAGITDGLLIYDITESTDPQLLGTHPIVALNMFVQGDYAYVLSGEMWSIIDVTDSENPTTVSETFTDRMNYRIQKVDDTIYIGEDRIGLKVYDVSDPENPELIRTVSNTAGIFDIAVQDDVLYLACHGNGVKSLDINDRMNPQLLDTYNDGGEAYGCHIVDGLLLVADLQEGIKILDVTDPTSITLIGSFTATHPHGVTGDESYVYLADQDHGLEIFQYGDDIEASTIEPEQPEDEPEIELEEPDKNLIPIPLVSILTGVIFIVLFLTRKFQ